MRRGWPKSVEGHSRRSMVRALDTGILRTSTPRAHTVPCPAVGRDRGLLALGGAATPWEDTSFFRDPHRKYSARSLLWCDGEPVPRPLARTGPRSCGLSYGPAAALWPGEIRCVSQSG